MSFNNLMKGSKTVFNKIVDFIIKFFKSMLPDFFKNNFEILSTRNLRIIAILVTAVLETVVLVSLNSFITLENWTKWFILLAALICPFIVGFTIAFSIHAKTESVRGISTLIAMLLLPVVTITMTECLNNIFIYNMTYLGFAANYILILIFYFIVFAITGNLKATIIFNSALLFGFALAHCYVVMFRGTPFIPMDFLSITTAAGVANTYNYSLTPTIIIALEIFVFLIVVGIKIKTPKLNLIAKIATRTFVGVFSLVVMLIFYFTSIFANMGIKPDFWNQSRGYRNYGFVFSFFCNTKYLYMSEPSGYDPNDVSDFISSTVNGNNSNDTQSNKPPVSSGNTPNIICIMNESLSDLSVLGNFTTNEDYMPFMRSLTENTIKGNLYVPVIGAGTSNTEFEFLTGHTTAFLPSGSNAYMLYIKSHIASMVSTLEGQGYSSFTFHPYYSSGWNRVSVYKYLGFDLFKSLENLFDISLMNEYVHNGSDPNYLQSLMEQYYPDRNMLLRQYVSDSYNYEVLIDDFENRDKSLPYFAFNVTMQNHGGYTTGCVNFDEKIYLTSTQEEYPKANRYLSLVKESDTAFKNLIEYFKNVDEPTVICMFGDHQPSIETTFISEVLGVKNLSNLTLEQEQKRHITPFFIWANYDIEEKQIDMLSSNYLSALVMKTAGVQLTEYNEYLLTLAETIPVISTVGYIDKDGVHYHWSDSTQYTSMLDQYEKIQYNNIFDRKNIDMKTFYLPNYVIPEIDDDDDDGIHSEGTIQ